ncbi:MAG: porin [Xanthobacteraceae bacterium]
MTRMKNILLGTVATAALSALAPAAYAADMDVKAPVVGDVKVSFFGTIDVGAYCGSAVSPMTGNGLPDYYLFSTPNVSPGAGCAIAGNALDISNIGVNVEKSMGYGFTAIGRLQTFYNPWSGESISAPGSIVRTNSQTLGNAGGFGDGGFYGQLLNGDVFAGVSHPVFGTVTVGRLKTLEFDDFLVYDPQNQSPAFSMIGFYGSLAGGGDTENRRWDNAIKYVWDSGPFHAAAMASTGMNDASQQGAWSADVGLHNVLGGLSVDGIYTSVKDGVAVLGPFAVTPQSNIPPTQALSGVGLENQTNTRVSDNQSYGVMAKYVFNLGGLQSGTYTKAPAPASTLTVYGGWEHVTQNDPSHQIVNGTSQAGGYIMGYVNNFGFLTPEQIDQFWVGAKYAVNQWTFTGAYYYQERNSWLAGTLSTTNAGYAGLQTSSGPTVCNPTSSTKLNQGATVVATPSSNCGGNFQSASFVTDYAFNKYVDMYAGLVWDGIAGGYTNGTQVQSQVMGITGLRLKF